MATALYGLYDARR